MDDSDDRLREMLARRGEKVRSDLTMSDIGDAAFRRHRHRKQVLAPVLVAASVVTVVVVIALGPRQSAPTIPPSSPGHSNSQGVTAPNDEVTRSRETPSGVSTPTSTVAATR